MYDVLIIGCGIVGAATAFELSKYNVHVGILEKENDVAEGTTKANSAILHAGYDPKPETLMAKLNVRGVALAKDLCRCLDVPYQQCGSMVLAFSEEDKATLDELRMRGVKNGVNGLKILTKEEALNMEPNLSPYITAALYAPTAAICSPWEFCLALAETAVRNGVELHLETEVTGIERKDDSWRVHTNRGDFAATYIVNASGVNADKVHDMALPHNYTVFPTKGEYYLLDKSEGNTVGCTIFQCPQKNGKGVLISPTVHGNLIVGPNSESSAVEDTSNTALGLEEVRTKALKSVPSLNLGASIRNFAGIRAITDKGDFILQEYRGFVDAAGICSPGLSAAPAIAEYLKELLNNAGLTLEPKEEFVRSRTRVRFKELSVDERKKLVAQNPSYGKIICRCETVTEGEILAAFESPIPPRTVDAVKRRVNAGMGRCQGGFCGPRVVELLANELKCTPNQILQGREGTWLLCNETKGGGKHV